MDQAVREPSRVSGRIKLEGEFLFLRHLPEVRQIRANDRDSVGTRQMGNTTASRGRRVGHDSDSGALKQIWQRVLWDIAAEFDSRIAGALFPH